MNRLSKEKRTQLILVIVTTLAVVITIWGTLIRAQQQSLQMLNEKRVASEKKQDQIRNTKKNSQQIEKDLTLTLRKLENQEEDMAADDLYASMYNSIRRFKSAYRVDIPEIKSTGVPTETDLLPEFPYKQVTVTISGTAYFFDLGKFVADFENRFPTSRIVDLDLSPASSAVLEDREKLAFKMDIVSLVRPGGTHSTGKP